MRSGLGFLMKSLMEVVKVGELLKRNLNVDYLEMTMVYVLCTVAFFSLISYEHVIRCISAIGVPLEDVAEEEGQVEEEEDGDIGEEDEMADFIVDEEELDENGAPVRYMCRSSLCVSFVREASFD